MTACFQVRVKRARAAKYFFAMLTKHHGACASFRWRNCELLSSWNGILHADASRHDVFNLAKYCFGLDRNAVMFVASLQVTTPALKKTGANAGKAVVDRPCDQHDRMIATTCDDANGAMPHPTPGSDGKIEINSKRSHNRAFIHS